MKFCRRFILNVTRSLMSGKADLGVKDLSDKVSGLCVASVKLLGRRCSNVKFSSMNIL